MTAVILNCPIGKKPSPEQGETTYTEPVTLEKQEEISYSLSVNKQQLEEPYIYTPLRLSLNGPTLPPIEIIETLGYNLYFCSSIEESRLAGGFSVNIACQRVLQEAFTDLYFNM